MGLRVVVFGQAAFGRDVAVELEKAGHGVVGVHVPPSKRPDPLAELAEERGWPLFRYRRYRRRREAIPELVEEYRKLGAELNVLPFTTVILPPEIVEAPPKGSLCFHPSILPAYRGGAALAWQIILGAEESGVTVFRPDAGVDTGPIVVQKRGVEIGPTETAGSLYFDKLYRLGVDAVVEATNAVADGTASFTPQPEEGASFQGLVDDEVARIDWSRTAAELDRLARGCDPQPGAHARLGGETVRLYDVRLLAGEAGGSDAAPGTLLGLEGGRLLVAARGGRLSVGRVRVGEGKKVAASESGLEPGARLD
jgi:methionyl-tRNA formyltransferase